jgi:hypothetical protein
MPYACALGRLGRTVVMSMTVTVADVWLKAQMQEHIAEVQEDCAQVQRHRHALVLSFP